MTTISTPRYLLDQAHRRLMPTLSTIPGMAVIEKRSLAHEWKTKVLAAPPAGSGLKPVLGNSGLPLLGHSIEMLRGGPDFALRMYRKYGPVFFSDVRILSSVNVLGPDATQAVFFNKNKDFSQEGWYPICGPFFNRGLMLLDFDEHL
ncbi:MAG: cytochrome P450, partial [Mycobacterium sp.]